MIIKLQIIRFVFYKDLHTQIYSVFKPYTLDNRAEILYH